VSGQEDIPRPAGDGPAAGAGAAVTARLFAGLESPVRGGRAEQAVPLSRAPTVAALCEAIGLAADVVGLVLVNGVHAEAATSLRPGDEISLFPPVGGG